jgi:hypothetical protein
MGSGRLIAALAAVACASGIARADGVQDFKLLVVPIPVINPAVGHGLTLAGVGLYRVGGSDRPWITAIGGLYTDTKTWGGLIGQKAYLDGDRFRLTGGLGGGVFNTNFFGIGHGAGARGLSVPLKETGKAAYAEALIRIVPHLYAGLQYRYLDLVSDIDLSHLPFPDLRIPDPQLDSRTSGYGIAAEYDTRDTEFAPRKGIYTKLVWLKDTRALGSRFDYDRVEASSNAYLPISRNSVLALRASLCQVGDHAPYYQLCSYGQQSDLRGYTSGQYIDHAMYTVQAEYRRHLFWRVGAVAFAGFGEVAPSFGGMGWRNILPGAGAGVRYLVSKSYGVNLRLDYAWGKGSHGAYFGIGEAF